MAPWGRSDAFGAGYTGLSESALVRLANSHGRLNDPLGWFAGWWSTSSRPIALFVEGRRHPVR